MNSFEDKISVNKADWEWFCLMAECEKKYKLLIKEGWKPQQARSVLPNSLKTEIVVTTNLREWKHIFMMRTSKKAHPQIRQIMIPLLTTILPVFPEIFSIVVKKNNIQKEMDVFSGA